MEDALDVLREIFYNRRSQLCMCPKLAKKSAHLLPSLNLWWRPVKTSPSSHFLPSKMSVLHLWLLVFSFVTMLITASTSISISMFLSPLSLIILIPSLNPHSSTKKLEVFPVFTVKPTTHFPNVHSEITLVWLKVWIELFNLCFLSPYFIDTKCWLQDCNYICSICLFTWNVNFNIVICDDRWEV